MCRFISSLSNLYFSQTFVIAFSNAPRDTRHFFPSFVFSLWLSFAVTAATRVTEPDRVCCATLLEALKVELRIEIAIADVFLKQKMIEM
jgi:hypothetical protein